MRRKSFLLIALVGLLALLSMPVFAGGEQGLERAMAAQEAHTDALLAKSGVVGTAVGRGADGQPVVKIYTARAGVAGLPRKLDDVSVQVQVTGELVAQSDPKAKFPRPVPIGVSSGTERLIKYRGSLYCAVGTLGARVTDGTNVFALSNAHVYALEGSDTYGDVQVGPDGDRILQPGRVDMTDQACGSQSEISGAVIGNLANYVPIVFSRHANNTVDAALASTTTGLVDNATPSDDGYGTPSATTTSASLGQAVRKYGRTTGLTTGAITGINATVLVRYDKGLARFVHQVIVEGSSGAFSAEGDSGSLIVTSDGSNSPVALLFAGSPSATIGNPIDLVLAAFGVTIDGLAGPTPTPTPVPPTPTPTVTPAPPTPTATATPVPTPTSEFTLSATGYKVKGLQKADLSWSGAASTNVDVYRDSTYLTTTANDDSYTDNIDNRGRGSYTYQVCEADTTTCSNEATVTF